MNPKIVHQSTHIIEKVDIEKILAMRESQKTLKERLALVEKAIEDAEANVISLLDSGVDLNQIGYQLKIQETARRYPKWKEEFISFAGKQAADRVLDETPATITRKLTIA